MTADALAASLILASCPNANHEAAARFLRIAEIVDSRPIGKGTTNPFRLTLSDGETTHDAAFQSIDERSPVKELEGGTEIRFADSFHFNIAAFHIAVLLGLDHMVPVTVERTWNRKAGSLTWWVEHKWDQHSRDCGCADGPLVFRSSPCTRAAPPTPPRPAAWASPDSDAADMAFARK